MSHHVFLIAVFLTLALLIPITLFFRVFRTLVTGIDASAKARDEARAKAEAGKAEQSASAAKHNDAEP